MKKNNKKNACTLQEIVENWKLNKALLCEKMQVNPYTFRMKMMGRFPYKFSEEDNEKLEAALQWLADEINHTIANKIKS